jgi:hypothetical protein
MSSTATLSHSLADSEIPLNYDLIDIYSQCPIWAILSAKALPNTVCTVTNESAGPGPWYLTWNKRPISVRAALEKECPDVLVTALNELNAGHHPSDKDDPQCGLALTETLKVSDCVMAFAMHKRNEPKARRGELEVAIGLRSGEETHGVSARLSRELAPTLDNYVCTKYGVRPAEPPPPPPAPTAEEIAAKQRQDKQDELARQASMMLWGNVTPTNIKRAAGLLDVAAKWVP